MAPLTARAHFIRRRIKVPMLEVHPRLSLWRIGRALKIAKSHLNFNSNSVEGDESRLVILKALMDRNIAFVYQQDLRVLVENNHAFEAFLCALTAYLKYRGQCAPSPKDFPRQEAWIEYPVEDIQWF